MDKIIEVFFGFNALGALIGWVAFNVGVFSLFKDENEQTFNLISYTKEHWDNWLGSFVFIPVFLFAGHVGFNFEDIGIGGVKWSDAYYVGSGFFFEAIKMIYKKWKKSKES